MSRLAFQVQNLRPR